MSIDIERTWPGPSAATVLSDTLLAVPTVGERVKEAREARGLGNNELDRLIGCEVGYSSRLESTDRQPRSDTLLLLAKVLRVRMEWLADGTLPRDLPPRETTTDPDERYPNRGEAEKIARIDGYSEDAIAEVKNVRLKSESDLPITEWLIAIRDAHHRLARFAPAIPEREPGADNAESLGAIDRRKKRLSAAKE